MQATCFKRGLHAMLLVSFKRGLRCGEKCSTMRRVRGREESDTATTKDHNRVETIHFGRQRVVRMQYDAL